MQPIDFAIGFFLMNAMPHFVLGIWKGRILSLFGFSPRANIAYGLLNFVASIALFGQHYGLEALAEQGIYVGALVVLLIYFVTGRIWFRIFAEGRLARGPGLDES